MNPRRRWIMAVGTWVFVALLTGCSPQRAFTEWVSKTPEPVRFGCAQPPAGPGSLPETIVLGNVMPGPNLRKFAGDIDQHPHSIYVPFSPETPPVAVLQADLGRILQAAKPGGIPAPASSPLRLDVTLQTAFAHRVYHFVKSSEIQGNVVFEVALVNPETGRTNWLRRITGRHEVRHGYVTSRAIEEALNGAYCQALAAFTAELNSPETPAVRH